MQYIVYEDLYINRTLKQNETHLPEYYRTCIFCYQKEFSLVLSSELFLLPIYEMTTLNVEDLLNFFLLLIYLNMADSQISLYK